MNTEICNTQSQLRDVKKLLKLDPGNTELLAQRHRLLGQAVSETKEKLETLKTAAEQANTALANGEISQEQYDALQREITRTENALRNPSQAGTSLRTIMNNFAGDVKICGSNIGKVTVATTNADGSMRDLSDILADCRIAFAGFSESEKAAAAEMLVRLFDQIPAWWSGLWQSVGDFFVNIWTSVKNMASPAWNGLKDLLASIAGNLKQAAVSAFQDMVPGIHSAIGNVVSAVSEAMAGVAGLQVAKRRGKGVESISWLNSGNL